MWTLRSQFWFIWYQQGISNVFQLCKLFFYLTNWFLNSSEISSSQSRFSFQRLWIMNFGSSITEVIVRNKSNFGLVFLKIKLFVSGTSLLDTLFWRILYVNSIIHLMPFQCLYLQGLNWLNCVIILERVKHSRFPDCWIFTWWVGNLLFRELW